MSNTINLQQLATAVYQRTTARYILVATDAAYFWHYTITFGEEVDTIWPQSNLKVGKGLFILTRYFSLAARLVDIFLSLPLHTPPYSQSTCLALYRAYAACSIISINASEAIYWVCLFALLGGKTRWFAMLVIGFIAFTIPIQVFQGIFVDAFRAVPPTALDTGLGYQCTLMADVNEIPKHATAAYISLARTTCLVVAAIITLIVRYRRQDNTLIKLIRREGGLYYLFAWVTNFLAGLTNAPKIRIINDKYNVLGAFRPLVTTVFAERLLLLMQHIEGYATQAVISTLVFKHEPRQAGADDEASIDVAEEDERKENDEIEMETHRTRSMAVGEKV